MITVSIVSHGHGLMVDQLIPQILACAEVQRVILTLNIAEPCALNSPKLVLIRNQVPQGFGANHNRAFQQTTTDYFCVLNPDISLESNPFPILLQRLDPEATGLVAPLVFDSNNKLQDSMRAKITILGMLKRLLGLGNGAVAITDEGKDVYPDWIAGMFMLFKSKVYSQVGGFDERFYMYCEDADICRRIKMQGYQISGCAEASVIHATQRASHRDLTHLRWHIRSLYRYLRHS